MRGRVFWAVADIQMVLACGRPCLERGFEVTCRDVTESRGWDR